jgi:t-SNARE complex subunit (syntaxin)
MEDQLIQLEISINELKKINNAIVYNVDTKIIDRLEKERSECISIIDTQCKNIKPKLSDQTRLKFIDLIKNYLTVQENYKNTKKNLFATQLLMRDPTLTDTEINAIIATGCSDKNVLCVANDFYASVKSRHNSILKLERDIEELRELFIAMYALVELQGIQVDRIAEHTESAKINCKKAKNELNSALKIKKF